MKPSYSNRLLPGIEPEPLTPKERRTLAACEAKLAKHLPKVVEARWLAVIDKLIRRATYQAAADALRRCTASERAQLRREMLGNKREASR